MMELRYRGKDLRSVVEDFDAFPKCVEGVQEDKKTSGALVAITCFVLVSWLITGEIRDYLQGHVEYKFLVDVNYNSTMLLDVDMVLAMPCHRVTADVSNVAVQTPDKNDQLTEMQRAFREFFPGGSGPNGGDGDDPNELKRSPTRFELTDREKIYWNMLQQAQRSQESTHGRYAAVSDLLYVQRSVQSQLDDQASVKTQEESRQSGHPPGLHPGLMHGGGGHQMIMFHGGGMIMQVINPSVEDGGGTACRVHGTLPIRKTTGTLEIFPGQKINMGPIQGRINMANQRDFNFSHRIAHLGFGPRLPGLVLPLAGTEKVSGDMMDLYQYYLKVVPTRLQRQFGQPITTYQYSVTHTRRSIDHSTGSHGMPGIVVKYELTPIMVEIRVPDDHTIYRLCIRLCSIAGGVFATSIVLYTLFSWLYAVCCGVRKEHHSASPDRHTLLQQQHIASSKQDL